MKMRKGWEGIPDINKAELEYMLSLLQPKFEFDIAILYGHYAGGRMRNEQGGYELLLLTQGDPPHEGWELEAYLKKEYPSRRRADWNLHIETVNIHTFNNINTANWFYWNIRLEGTIIYDSGKTQGIFHNTQFKHIRAYKLARSQYDYFFLIGSDLLDEAERLWRERKPALVAINLSYAAQFLLRAQETVFYGNFVQTSRLQVSFRRARVFSRKLIIVFNRSSCSEAPFFEQLEELRHAPREYIDFILPARRYHKFLYKLRMLQDIIHDSCKRHLFYLEHNKSKQQMMREKYLADIAERGNRLLTAEKTDHVRFPINNDEMCDDSIYKQDIKQFLDKLQQEAHWMYALMHHSSKSAIRIFYEDIEKGAIHRISVSEFENRYDEFHPQMAVFAIHFDTYHFKDENVLDFEATGEFELLNTNALECSDVLEMAPYILAFICRQAIEAGEPFVIDDTTIEKYGFTSDDAEYLRDKVADINNRLTEEFKANYNQLKKMSIIWEHSNKN